MNEHFLHEPYNDPSANFIYNLLFCDDLDLYRDNTPGEAPYPLSVIYDPDSPTEELGQIAADPEQDPRARILASERLLDDGDSIRTFELLAVVLEVGISGGVDTLASFVDGTARFIHNSGQIVVWEDQDDQMQALTDLLFTQCTEVINDLEWFEGKRLPAPQRDNDIRLTVMTTDGRCVLDTDYSQVIADEKTGVAFNAAGMLLTRLTELAFGQQQE